MPGSSIGGALRLQTFGESHGAAVGCVVDGCPAGVPLDVARISGWLARRRPGSGPHVSARREPDVPRVLSGTYEGLTLGTPICVVVENLDARPDDYAAMHQWFRPGHADFGWHARFGHRDPRGGGRSSARETVGRVIGGAVAQAIFDAWTTLRGHPRLEIVAWVQSLGAIEAHGPAPHMLGGSIVPAGAAFAFDPQTLTSTDVDRTPLRCPDATAHAAMVAALECARRDRDSLGGVVRCVARNVPAGLGDPTFDKVTGLLAHALGSLPAVRGVQFGSGFAAAGLRGSAHNDAFVRTGSGGVATATNHAGGALGGLTTGMPLVIDVAFKPPATIPQPQTGIGPAGPAESRTVTGRHDPCVAPRAVPIVEAAVFFVLADLLLRPARLDSLP
ncbi:MAG: chorismate synthase [Myxococcales bacterium]|nr:chorismate synthase [Myxococcales bacterium]